MADWVTISSLATAGGTLVLAVATFSSVRSANRAARTAEVSLLANIRPVLIPSREDDPTERLMFGEGHRLTLHGHGAVVEQAEGNLYMALGLRNAGPGLGVLHGWLAQARELGVADERPDLERFHRQQLDIYIPAGDAGSWRAAIRDREDENYKDLARALRDGTRISIDLLYGDHEGGQRAIARFNVVPNDQGEGLTANVVRYWNVDRDDPR
jgi:hypothetical protein